MCKSSKTSILFSTGLIFLIISFTACLNAQHTMVKEKPEDLNLEGAYYQEIQSGNLGGSAKLMIFFPKQSEEISLKTIYFKGKKGTFFSTKDGYYATIIEKTSTNAPDPKKPLELITNKKQTFEGELGFQLKHSDCIIGYKKEDKSYLFKLKDTDALPKKDNNLPKNNIPQGY